MAVRYARLNCYFPMAMVATMTTVSIADLQENLSRYIHEVRHGGEIQVLDGGTPVARISPPLESGDNLRNTLIQAGVLRPGNGRAREILDKPLLELSTSLSEALMEDRKDRL